jgi:hypothetical protein
MNNDRVQKHSQAWVAFSYSCVCLSVLLLGYGLMAMPIDMWQRFFLTMGIAMLAQAVIVCTKTIRDNEEANRLLRRIDDIETTRMIKDSASTK